MKIEYKMKKSYRNVHLLLVCIGFLLTLIRWLNGFDSSFVAILGASIVVANFICETLMGFINTVDIVDAIYGTIGIMIVFIYFYCVNSNGLIQINSDNGKGW